MAKTDEDKPAAVAADQPAWKGSLSASKPIIAPDGHVTLSQEDIDNRDKEV